MKGYMIVTYRKCADAATMEAYAVLALPALFAHGARFIARTAAGQVDWRESGTGERVVVLEFPSKQEALAAYDSTAYQAAVRVLQGKVERDVCFVSSYNSGENEPASEDRSK